MRGFYFITDAGLSKKGNSEDVKKAVLAKATAIQYRAKDADVEKMKEEAFRLKALCQNISFIVNDNVDVALAVDADGVHLGENDMPYAKVRELLGKTKIIGLSVHSVEQAKEAEENGVDYIAVGPIFTTTTKKDANAPCGVSFIKEIKQNCKLPLVALGGINLENVQDVAAAGADVICAIAATVSKDDVQKEIQKLI